MSDLATPDSPPEFYSPDRVAEILDCHRNTVDRLIARGVIGSVKLGRMVRIPATELSRLAVQAQAS